MAERDGPAGLAVDDLTVRYFGRDVDALSGVTLEVPPGALVGVAGPNGAGKSTLALAAAGFIPRIVRAKVTGEVRVRGQAVASAAHVHGQAAAERPVGIVFSNPGNQMSGTKVTVREELAFGLENLGVPRGEMDPRIDAVLVRLGIAHLAERSPFALSGGEQQRVAIATIVAMGTSVLVLDEPTAQLDPGSTAAVRDLLVDLARGGTAVLLTEHAPDVLAATSRTFLLDDGRIVADGRPAETLASEAAQRAGVNAPTLLVLGAAAGLPAGSGFDEAAVARALREAADRGTLRAIAATSGPGVGWRPVRVQPDASIDIAGLVHRYGGVEALRGIDLGIAQGERVAVIGQNGSGKTTLVKHLNGLLRADSGSVRIGGGDIGGRRVHELASAVGFVFQNPDDQLFNRSVEREVGFGPRTLRLSADDADRLVSQALDATGLEAERSTNPYDLNVSTRKLVALASVLATDPAVLVLDEPTTGQDGLGVRRVGAIVDALGHAGRTVVAITHDMEFAARHFDRVVVMRQGEIVLDGPPAAVFAPTNAAILDSTGLVLPPAARIAARLGVAAAPADAEGLVERIRAGSRGRAGILPT